MISRQQTREALANQGIPAGHSLDQLVSFISDSPLPWYIPSTHPQWILCRLCGAVSHHPGDVQQHYCGDCHLFLDDWLVHQQFADTISS